MSITVQILSCSLGFVNTKGPSPCVRGTVLRLGNCLDAFGRPMAAPTTSLRRGEHRSSRNRANNCFVRTAECRPPIGLIVPRNSTVFSASGSIRGRLPGLPAQNGEPPPGFIRVQLPQLRGITHGDGNTRGRSFCVPVVETHGDGPFVRFSLVFCQHKRTVPVCPKSFPQQIIHSGGARLILASCAVLP